MPKYGEPKYWEKRYKDNEGQIFDWLEDYDSLKEIINKIQTTYLKLPKQDIKILNVGCGNAKISEDMYDDGYVNNFNIDISFTVIEQMNKRKGTRKQLIYQQMDAKNMYLYKENSFDLVIDKSTMDALLCGDFSYLNVAAMLKEIQRVLKVDGIYVVISYGSPEDRISHFFRQHLALELVSTYSIQEVNEKNKPKKKVSKQIDNDDESENKQVEDTDNNQDEPSLHYVYILKKKPYADIIAEKFWKSVQKLLMDEYIKEREEEKLIGGKDEKDSNEGSEKDSNKDSVEDGNKGPQSFHSNQTSNKQQQYVYNGDVQEEIQLKQQQNVDKISQQTENSTEQKNK